MIEEGKISGLQMAILMYPTIMATGVLLVPSMTGLYAKQDMWFSPILASTVGIITVWIAHKLNSLYPSKSFMQYFEVVLGRYLGKALGLIYILFYLHLSGIVLREYSEFVNGNFLVKTPMIVVMGSMIFVCATAVRSGLEVLARTAQLFVPVVVVLFLLIILLLFPDLDSSNMLPIFENGLGPAVKGAIIPQSWYSEFIVTAFFLPFINKNEKKFKWGILSVLMVTFTFVITNFASLFLFGELNPSLTYPVMSAARYISIANFLEHLESIVMAIWVLGVFIKISVFYYAVVQGTAQWLNLSDYRAIVFPIGILIILFGVWSADDLQDLAYFLMRSAPLYLTGMQMVIPFLLLLLGLIKKRFSPKQDSLGPSSQAPKGERS